MNRREYPAIGETCWEARLANGLRVRVVPKRGFIRKYAILAVDFGSIDTSFTCDGKTCHMPDGIAHYLEHKMFDLPEGNAMELFAACGGVPNAFTSYAMTAYHFTCTEKFAENLKILLRLVSTPYFTEESVEKERGIIAQEIRMYEDSADSRVSEELFRAICAHHPVRVPIAGSVESIGTITAQMLYDCHAAFYRPENMILCVVGDVEPQQVFELAQTLPGGGKAPERDYGAPENLKPARAYTELSMQVSMPTFSIGFPCAAPERGMAAMRREIVGDFAADVLLGESSPLYLRLYEQGLIDADFSAGYESVKDVCMLTVNGDSRDPQAVRAAILDEAERIAREGVDPALFERLRRSILGSRTRGLDNFESIGYHVCAYGFEDADYFRFPEVYASVTPEELRRFLAETVTPERAAISVIRPKEEA